jgi:two-component system phosphate regulon sensor histidine kinase PhoR
MAYSRVSIAMIPIRKPRTGPSTLLVAWSVVILVLALLVGGYYLAELEGNAYRSALEANDYLLKMRTTYRLLVNMETSERGYVISANESFLDPYKQAQQELPALWSYLAAKARAVEPEASDTHALGALITDLKSKAETWQRDAAEPEIALRRAGRTQEAFDAAASGTGKVLFDDLRTAATQVEDRVDLDIRAFDHEANRLSSLRQGLFIAVGIFALGTSVFAARIAQGDRKRREQAVRAAEAETERLRTVLDNMPVAVRFLSAPRGDVILQNRAASELIPAEIWNSLEPEERPAYFGFSSPEGVPLPIEAAPAMRALKEGVGATNYEFRLNWPQIGTKHILASTAPLRNENGEVIASVVAMRDISEMKELDRRKDEFIATAAHELRNPLTAIMGNSQLLLKYMKSIDAPPKTMGYAEKIGEQISRLNSLVELLLDTSRIQLGRLILDKSEVDLVQAARTVAANAQAAEDGDRSVTVQGPADGVTGQWDAVRIEQVLTNLVNNALLYSPASTNIEVRVSRQGREARVEVIDRGPGVPEDQRPALFDRYYQGPHPTTPQTADPPRAATRRRGSLGLGLYLSSEIIKAHEGHIGMDPNPTGGSIFWFTLPV